VGGSLFYFHALMGLIDSSGICFIAVPFGHIRIFNPHPLAGERRPLEKSRAEL
jgi:hypothetical protein